jgi:hypothetical protein
MGTGKLAQFALVEKRHVSPLSDATREQCYRGKPGETNMIQIKRSKEHKPRTKRTIDAIASAAIFCCFLGLL